MKSSKLKRSYGIAAQHGCSSPLSSAHRKGSCTLPEARTTTGSVVSLHSMCTGVCVGVWDRQRERKKNICWHILEAVQQKLSDASLRIKGEGRNRTLSLTYSTSAQNNIEHGCTAPTSIPLVLFSSMHRNLLDVQYNPLETHCLVIWRNSY